jgi:polygalacturonase
MEVSNSDDNVLMENYITNNSEISQYDLITLLDNKDIENLSVELNLNDPKMDEEFDNTNEIEFYLTE